MDEIPIKLFGKSATRLAKSIIQCLSIDDIVQIYLDKQYGDLQLALVYFLMPSEKLPKKLVEIVKFLLK